MLFTLLRGPAAYAQFEEQPDFEKQRAQEEGEEPPPREVRAPVILRKADPVYPPQALREGRRGTVVLRIAVDVDGAVRRVEVVESAGADLDYAAMGAAAAFGFQPGTADGVPVSAAVLFRQRFDFTESQREAAARAAGPPPLNFLGQVREAGTKEVLPEAEVTVHLDDGTILAVTADDGGRFELRGVPAGRWMVHIAHPEHELMTTVEEFSAREAVEARYFLPRRSYNRFETVIRDRRPSKEVTRISLSRDEVNRVPGTFGDPIRAIEALPSMGQGTLFGGALLVRGTPPRSTAVYYDGVQIPQLYHFGMLRSVIHPELLENIEVYPGGFGPQYGRATAGVVDVRSRKLSLRGCRGVADISFLESGFFFGCGLTWGKARNPDAPDPRRITFAFAGRRSYFDAFVPLALEVVNPGQRGSIGFAPVYSDYQAKLEYRPVAAHHFSLLAFGSDDFVKFFITLPQDAGGGQGTFRFELQFHRLLGRWRWNIHPRMRNDFQVYTGLDSAFLGVHFTDGRPPPHRQLSAAGINNTGPVFGIREELRWDHAEWLSLLMGFEYAVNAPRLLVSTHEIGPLEQGREGTVDASTPLRHTRNVLREDRRALNLAPYLQVLIQPLPGLLLIPGFRWDYFLYSRDTRMAAPTPRFTGRWEPFDGTILKATSGVYYQAPRAYETSFYVGNPALLPERSFQNTVGFEQRLTPWMTVAINGFLNFRDDLVQLHALPINVDVDVGLPLFQTIFDNASIGRVYGVDFLLRHEITKHFYAWIAYTLSKSEVNRPPDDVWRMFNFDQTHILTFVGQYRIPWHFPFREWSRSGRLPRNWLANMGWAILAGDVSVGWRFRYVTGNPENYFQIAQPVAPEEEGQRPPEPLFVRRFSTWHQLDVRVDYKMTFDLWLMGISLDVLNVYNSKADDGDIPRIPLLPVLGINVEI
ncbi:MAG: TonB-dependent receptor [Deltaproteobacteria bacterium]|nr:TonB-dependent receptor [Deltaproteobacteria bacterium]